MTDGLQVQNAQAAGAIAAIVYDHVDDPLVTLSLWRNNRSKHIRDVLAARIAEHVEQLIHRSIYPQQMTCVVRRYGMRRRLAQSQR